MIPFRFHFHFTVSPHRCSMTTHKPVLRALSLGSRRAAADAPCAARPRKLHCSMNNSLSMMLRRSIHEFSTFGRNSRLLMGKQIGSSASTPVQLRNQFGIQYRSIRRAARLSDEWKKWKSISSERCPLVWFPAATTMRSVCAYHFY